MEKRGIMRFFFGTILVLFYLLGCKSPTLILKEPIGESQPGLVAFGLILHDDISPSLLEKHAKWKQPEPTRTFFYQFNSSTGEINWMSKVFIIPKPRKENIEINGTLYNEQSRMIIRNEYITYFLFTNLEEDKEYLLGKTSYSYTTGRISVRGRRTEQVNYIDIPIELKDFSKVLKLKTIPRKISFLGNFLVRVSLKEKGNFLGYNEQRIGSVEKISLPEDAVLYPSIYGSEEISETGAEIFFLKRLLMNSVDGYWKKLITDRLTELLKN